MAVANSATSAPAFESHSFAVESFDADKNAPLSVGNQSTAVAVAVWPPDALGAIVKTGP